MTWLLFTCTPRIRPTTSLNSHFRFPVSLSFFFGEALLGWRNFSVCALRPHLTQNWNSLAVKHAAKASLSYRSSQVQCLSSNRRETTAQARTAEYSSIYIRQMEGEISPGNRDHTVLMESAVDKSLALRVYPFFRLANLSKSMEPRRNAQNHPSTRKQQTNTFAASPRSSRTTPASEPPKQTVRVQRYPATHLPVPPRAFTKPEREGSKKHSTRRPPTHTKHASGRSHRGYGVRGNNSRQTTHRSCANQDWNAFYGLRSQPTTNRSRAEPNWHNTGGRGYQTGRCRPQVPQIATTSPEGVVRWED